MTELPLPGPLSALKAFARERTPVERCDLCDAALGHGHDHLLEVKHRTLKCTCAACALLFQSGPGGQWKRVRSRVEPLPDFHLEDPLWAELQLPIDLAYFQGGAAGPRAFFPSPAGATESLLPLRAWETLIAANPVLGSFEEDVEALLVNRVGAAREYYRVSIDECFALVGIIRSLWRGFTGGTEAWAAIEAFFSRLKGERRA